MTRKTPVYASAFLALSICPVIVFAQTSQDQLSQTEQLDPVTVIGEPITPPPVESVSTPYGTQYNIVTEQDLERQGTLSFVNAFKNVPGVIYQSKNAVGAQTSHSLYIRGRGASHPSPDLAIEFDGVPRSGVLYGQTLGDGIAVGTIGSMDIYKSPLPAVFGSGYAAVSITPKRMMEEGIEANFGIQGGSYSTFNENLGVGYKKGRFDIYALQDWTSSNGNRPHSRSQQQSYYVNLGWALHENWEARFLVNVVSAQTLAPMPDETPSATNGVSWPMAERFDTDTTFTTLTLSHSYEAAQGYAKLYWNDTQFDLRQELNSGKQYPNGGRWSRQSNKMYGLRMREHLQLWENNQTTLGFDYDKTDLKNTQHVNGTGQKTIWNFPDITLFSPYFGISQTIGDPDKIAITPSVGLRYYHHNEFGNKTAPQAGIVVDYKPFAFNMSYARGVNYPSPVVLQGLLGPTGPTNPSSYWRDLKAETVDHYEIGVKYNWQDQLNLGATTFYDKGKDRFRAYFGGPTPNMYNDPIGRYRIHGLELSASYTPPSKKFNVFAAGTWLNAKATGQDNVERNHMPYTPSFTLQAGAQWNIDQNYSLYADMQHLHNLYQGTAMRTGFNYSESDKLNDITLVNARLARKLNELNYLFNQGEVYVGVDNLFDKKYEYARGYPMPGITVNIGLNLKFK